MIAAETIHSRCSLTAASSDPIADAGSVQYAVPKTAPESGFYINS